MRLIILLLTLTLLISSGFAKIYTWKDTTGRTVYGDNPPQKEKAKEVITKELTIIEGYKDPSLVQSKTVNTSTNNDVNKNIGESNANSNETAEAHSYETFQVSYPANDEAIRANSGNITVSFALTPGLQKGDSVFVYLDGKKMVENSKSLTASFTNLDRGSHSMFAVIRNANGDVLINSNTVSFHVLRNSIIKK